MEGGITRQLVDSIVDKKTTYDALEEVWGISRKDVIVVREIVLKASTVLSGRKFHYVILDVLTNNFMTEGRIRERKFKYIIKDIKIDYQLLVEAMFDNKTWDDIIWPVSILNFCRKQHPTLDIRSVLSVARKAVESDPDHAYVAEEVIEFLTREDV